jgi:hypothetical protein
MVFITIKILSPYYLRHYLLVLEAPFRPSYVVIYEDSGPKAILLIDLICEEVGFHGMKAGRSAVHISQDFLEYSYTSFYEDI